MGSSPMLITLDSDLDGKTAVSHVSTLQVDPGSDLSLVEVVIDTGRKHQIRKHLATAGFPVVGDRLYGIADRDADNDLMLTSSYLAFKSPEDGTDKSYSLTAALLPCMPTDE